MRPNALNATVLPSLALDSGTPCRNDEAGVGRLQHLEFIHYRVTKEKLPGGFEFGVEALKNNLTKEAPELRSISTNPHQTVGKLEKAVIKLAQHSLGVGIDLRNYDRNKVLSNLENANRISSEESVNIRCQVPDDYEEFF